MKVEKTILNDAFIIEPDIYGDERGFFQEVYHHEKYKNIIGENLTFVQDNYSRSQKNVLRGLHFQTSNPQGKLVRVVRGSVFDVAVDLRKNSSTYGYWYGIELNEWNKKQFWIPPGMAHGFLVLSDIADFEYKCTDFYHPEFEKCLIWNDPIINVKWPINEEPILSPKDRKGIRFEDL
ncbi:TPA: dTDP-4-dehydrorhamnose 3,5-epimerase [Escherichia coli]|nr:dTDP-4-dehydrorhamnose 3,5-epimerase [Escherichia coli]